MMLGSNYGKFSHACKVSAQYPAWNACDLYTFYYNNRQEILKNSRSILFAKNQDFNELHKAFVKSFCACFFTISAQCREMITLAVFLIM